MNISFLIFSFFNIYLISYFLVLCNAVLLSNKSSFNKGIKHDIWYDYHIFWKLFLSNFELVVCMIYIMLITFSSNPLFWLKLASNRVINPIKSDERHPWLAFLLTQEQRRGDLQEESIPFTCTGSVISKRYDY